MEKAYQSISISEFHILFPDTDSCYIHLSNIKWKGGFSCTKCGHIRYSVGQGKQTRKCTKCDHQMSATSGTVFHKLKFDLLKAFQMVYFLSTTKNGMASTELSRKVGLRQKTCWLFKRKIMTAMRSSGNHPLTGEIEVDETVVGGQESGTKGRRNVKKKLVVVAIERRKDGIARAYAEVIPNAGSKQLKPFFESKIDTDAQIRTDKWRGYGPLKDAFPNLEQNETGKKGKNFPVMHRWIMGMKSWLRGVHHHARDLQAYLDEYCYRYNRNKMKEGIFDNLMQRMMTYPPKTYAQILVA